MDLGKSWTSFLQYQSWCRQENARVFTFYTYMNINIGSKHYRCIYILHRLVIYWQTWYLLVKVANKRNSLKTCKLNSCRDWIFLFNNEHFPAEQLVLRSTSNPPCKYRVLFNLRISPFIWMIFWASIEVCWINTLPISDLPPIVKVNIVNWKLNKSLS